MRRQRRRRRRRVFVAAARPEVPSHPRSPSPPPPLQPGGPPPARKHGEIRWVGIGGRTRCRVAAPRAAPYTQTYSAVKIGRRRQKEGRGRTSAASDITPRVATWPGHAVAEVVRLVMSPERSMTSHRSVVMRGRGSSRRRWRPARAIARDAVPSKSRRGGRPGVDERVSERGATESSHPRSIAAGSAEPNERDKRARPARVSRANPNDATKKRRRRDEGRRAEDRRLGKTATGSASLCRARPQTATRRRADGSCCVALSISSADGSSRI